MLTRRNSCANFLAPSRCYRLLRAILDLQFSARSSFRMFVFDGIKGYDQLKIETKSSNSSLGDSNKWTRQQKEVFHLDLPKILVTWRHVFVAHQNSIFILDTKPLSDVGDAILYVDRKEFKIESHTSPVTCFGVEEAPMLLCSCSDEHVFLSKWDSLLGHWDTKAISEEDGRILSCSVAFKGTTIYSSLFKSDVILVYKVESAHAPTDHGPLILDSIECFATLDKVKELTSWSKSLFLRNAFYIIGVASGNTVTLKVWEVVREAEQNLVKLKYHRMVSNVKTTAGADVTENDHGLFILVAGSNGAAEVFHMCNDCFSLLYRFKLEEQLEPTNDTSILNQSSSNLQCSSKTALIHGESRILCTKFFMIQFPTEQANDDSFEESGNIGDGDAKVLVGRRFRAFTQRTAPAPPKLIVAVVTTRGVNLVNAVSGHIELTISHGELMKDETIFIQNAQLATNASGNEIILGLQSCLTRVVFSRRFAVKFEHGNESEECREASLIPREALNSKSVLRKKIKSPPRHPTVYPVIAKRNKSGVFRNSGNQPSWARSRSRPLVKSGGSGCWAKNSPPQSARSHHSTLGSSTSKGLLQSESESLTTRIVKIPATGCYEDDNLSFEDTEKVMLSSNISHGISILRIASTNSGKHLAFGGNINPLVIVKTRPFQNYRTFKDIGKVANVHFNFTGNLLVIASSDCKTTLVDWQNSKELLSFNFSSKFNEHVHSQFYFMDKFILQPEENKLVLYSYAKRENAYIKLKAGDFQLAGQTITALGAANQFYSNMVIAGVSNKSIQVFDTNAEMISITIPNAHSKPVSCIRINEAPKGVNATSLCDVFLTSSFTSVDPIKLWDIRSSKCVMRISDINQAMFIPTARPDISPCGRYIASGFEDCCLSFYDIRKVRNRVSTLKKLGSTVLDCCFDSSVPMLWSGCRNGNILNFYIP